MRNHPARLLIGTLCVAAVIAPMPSANAANKFDGNAGEVYLCSPTIARRSSTIDQAKTAPPISATRAFVIRPPTELAGLEAWRRLGALPLRREA